MKPQRNQPFPSILIILIILVFLAHPGNGQERKSTALSTVQIMDTAFQMTELGRTRLIRIRLPKDYDGSKKKYPVLYMHDGQNLFDAATSYAGEWGVDEALDSLGVKWGECIVVGIDNGPRRMNEYAPYDFKVNGIKDGKGEGTAYAHFLINELKPFIDKKYRTKRGRKHTFIAGSSMGGLISMYAVLQYPRVFGGAGVFSPSFWIAKDIYPAIDGVQKKLKTRIYFFAGMQEGPGMVPEMLQAFEAVRKKSRARITVAIRGEGKHNEATWRAELPAFFQFLWGG